MTTGTASVLLGSGIQVIGALLFAVVLRHFERAGRPFLRYWTLSWLAFAVYTAGAVASRLLSGVQPPTAPLRILLSVASLAAGLLQLFWLIAGTYEFSRRHASDRRLLLPAFAGALVLGAALTLVWIGDPSATSARYFARVGVRVLLTGAAFSVAAFWLAIEARQRGLVSWLLPGALFAYGGSQVATFFWALPLTALTPETDMALRMALGALEVFLLLLIGLGMLLWLLQREREDRRLDWQQLAESEERYRTLAESAPDAIVTLDAEGRIVFANSATGSTFGYAVEDLMGQPVSRLFPEQAEAPSLTSFARGRRATNRPEAWSALRLHGRHRSGRAVPIEMSLTEHVFGGARRLTFIARDVSERQRLEEQLLQAQKMQALDRLAGGIAHDFNNLLMAIAGHAELAVAQLDSAHAARSGILEIRRAAERAGDLTTKLLAFSRKQPIQARRLDLNVAVSELAAMLARIISEDIAIEIRLMKEPAYVDADPGLIDQLLLNLAINARDAMSGGGRLTLATSLVEFDTLAASRRADAQPGIFVCVRVTDTGTGIDPQHMPNIFEPFFTTKDVGKGTGLGLATTYGVARQHGGWIEVESAVGIGTSFRVFLPRQEAPDATAVPLPLPPLAEGRETILLVEDEPQVRAVISRVLNSCGYTVIEAVDGLAALATWDAHRGAFDLLLTDVVMPRGLTGPDLAGELRRRKPDLRVVLMTGYQAEMKLDAVPPDTPLLRKPFSLAEMTRIVQDTLDMGEELSELRLD